jgi:hypothetical protein
MVRGICHLVYHSKYDNLCSYCVNTGRNKRAHLRESFDELTLMIPEIDSLDSLLLEIDSSMEARSFSIRKRFPHLKALYKEWIS